MEIVLVIHTIVTDMNNVTKVVACSLFGSFFLGGGGCEVALCVSTPSILIVFVKLGTFAELI